jgi:hypothetical protein
LIDWHARASDNPPPLTEHQTIYPSLGKVLGMVKKAGEADKPNRNAWSLALLGWLVPGLGHVVQGRTSKGIVTGLTVLTLFVVGVLIGGHIYSIRDTNEGLLSLLFGLCDLGNGLAYFSSKLVGFAVVEQPQRAMSEYGSVFLMASGLLNFILALDAFDIGVGRKS